MLDAIDELLASIDQQLIELLVHELDSPAALTRFRAFRDAQAPSRGHPSLPWSEADAELPAETDLRLRWLASRALLNDRGHAAQNTANGQIYTFASSAQPILCALLGGAPPPSANSLPPQATPASQQRSAHSAPPSSARGWSQPNRCRPEWPPFIHGAPHSRPPAGRSL
ncbi:hypothetical protein [Streptomyces sp. 8N616]|uniref:hypothetical protein n=1 Tax=Streptomyces sp. 8N616 TaxID=3457414 RepID=UPI003FD5770A